MTQASDLARIDRILDQLEHEAEAESDPRKFTLRLLEQLRLVSGATSAVFMAAVESGAAQKDLAGSSIGTATEKTWLTLGLAGEALAVDVASWLNLLPGVDRKESETLPLQSRLVWRAGGEAFFAVGLPGDTDLLGAIVISLSEPCPAAAEDGLLALIQGFAEIFGDRLRRHQRRSWVESQSYFDRFLIELYTTGSLVELAGCMAHDLPAVIQCQRVAVVSQIKTGQWRVDAVTGASQANHRTDTIVALEHLARLAATAAQPMLCSAPDTLRLAPTDKREVGQQEQPSSVPNASDLLLLPLADPGSLPAQASPVSRIVVLQWSDANGVNASLPRIRRVLPHLAVAWSHARRGTRTLGGWVPDLFGYRLRLAVVARWVALVAVIGFFVWAMIGIEADFDIEAAGKLEPLNQRIIFATHDGYVDELAVEDGNQVATGQLLVQLRSPDLELRQREIEGEMATARKRRDGLSIAINQLHAGQRETLITSRQLAAEVESLDEKLKGLASLQELLRRQQDSLALRSPIEGAVVTWDARRNLESRPVQRGDSLLKVAHLSGPWRLRVWVPDRELAHVKEAQLSAGSDHQSENPQITFKLTSRPGESYHGNLISIGNTVQVLDDRGPVIPVDFSFDRDQVPDLQVGATATGRIHCGQRRWWYIWTRTLVETVQRRFWLMGGGAVQ